MESDGKVFAKGYNYYNQCDIPENINISYTQIACSGYHTVLLKNDRTVNCIGRNDEGQDNATYQNILLI